MPTPEVEKRLEEIKAQQRKRGVIPALQGRHWPKEGIEQPVRQQLALDLEKARKGTQYLVLGTHYERQMRTDFPDFKRFVAEKIGKAKLEKRRVRWLDIGPGHPFYFMTYFDHLAPEGTNVVDLHTLSPEQILPKGKNTPQDQPPQTPKQLKDWLDYLAFRRFKHRLTHHVGAIETHDSKKLGKFHIIVSSIGGTLYSKQPQETLLKVAKLLHRGGRAFVDAPSHTNIPELQKQLGRSFSVQSTYKKYLESSHGCHLITITRQH